MPHIDAPRRSKPCTGVLARHAIYVSMVAGESLTLDVGGKSVQVSNPGKLLFPQIGPKAGVTKLDLVQYYIAVAEGALAAAGGRPNMLVRYPNGVESEHFYQKRAPSSRPPWVDVVS